MGKKAVPTFRQCVDARYQHDLVMNGFATLMVILVPLLVLLVVFLLSRTDSAYGVLSDYMEKATVLCIVLESYVLMIIVYMLYSRLTKHSKRDRMWMLSLTEYARSKGAPTDKLQMRMRESSRKEHFLVRPIALFLLAAMFAFVIWVAIDAVPYINDLSGDNKDFFVIIGGNTLFTLDVVYIALLGGFLLMLPMLVFVFIPTVSFPGAHEKRQVAFTKTLCESLESVGISTLPMTRVVKGVPVILALFLIMFTGYIGAFFLTFRVFRDMNNHLMNEWVYEAELLQAVESDGKEGFDDEFYDRSPEKAKKTNKRGTSAKRFAKKMKNMIREENRLPGILVIAELFLLVLLGNYMLKMIALGCMMSDEIENYVITLDNWKDVPMQSWVNIALIVMDTFFIKTMIDSILGIASRKASSWRKVVRSCITFVIPLWISAFVTQASGMSHLFDFNVFITTAILYDVMLMMIVSYNIRRFYTPAGYEMPRVRSWIRYALWGNIIPTVTAGTAFADDAFDGTEFSGASSGSARDALDTKKLKKKGSKDEGD